MRFFVIRFLRYYDFSPPFVQKIIHRITHFIFGLLHKFRYLTSANLLPVQTYLVHVSDIRVISKRIENNDIFSKYLYHGVIIGGDWDLEYEPIEAIPLFEFSYKVFVENQKMEDTNYYRQILAGNLEPYIQGEDHLRLRMNKYINLFKQIQDKGYKPQTEIRGGNFFDEICISIDRNGHYILEDGRHRFMIAKCLNLETIPVLVNRVHENYWNNTKEHWDTKLNTLS